MTRRAAWIALSVYLLAAALGAPSFAEEGWRQFIISDVVGAIGSGSTSQLVENDDWAKYAPRKLFDGSKDSAWVEGDGVGEQVWFTVDLGTADLILTNGFARSASLFQKNNRVKRLEASLWVGVTAEIMVSELGRIYQARPVPGKLALPLADKATSQSLALPYDWGKAPGDPEAMVAEYRAAFEVPEDEACWAEYIVCLEIREVYRGTAYRDTCIAEIAGTLPRAVAGPGGRCAVEIAGYCKAEAGAEWEFLRLSIEAGILLFTYLGDRLYDSGLWYVGDGRLALESDAAQSTTFIDGELAGDTLVLIGEDGHKESYARVEE